MPFFARNMLGVLVGVQLAYFGVFFGQTLQGVNLKFTEVLANTFERGRVELLIAKEYDLMVGDGLLQVADLLVLQRLGQIDAGNDSTDGWREPRCRYSRVTHYILPLFQ